MSNEVIEKSTWRKVLGFAVELIKLVIAAFLGAEGSAIL